MRWLVIFLSLYIFIPYHFVDAQVGIVPERTSVIEVEDSRELVVLIAKIVRGLASLLSVLFFVILIVGGFKWLGSGGNEVMLQEAKHTVFVGVVGMIILMIFFIVSMMVIVRFQ